MPGALEGATAADDVLLRQVMAGAGDFNDLVGRSCNARVRLVILIDIGAERRTEARRD